jgi:hypothetical protein
MKMNKKQDVFLKAEGKEKTPKGKTGDQTSPERHTSYENIAVFFLTFLGGSLLSPWARWLTGMMSIGAIQWLAYLLLFFAVVLLYSFLGTLFLTRFNRGSLASPYLVWGFIWLFNLIQEFYQRNLNIDMNSVSPLIVSYIISGIGVIAFAYIQSGIINHIFGYSGTEKSCYRKAYYSSTDLKDLAEILLKDNWLFYTYGLGTTVWIEEDAIKMRAYDFNRKYDLSLFLRKDSEGTTGLDLISYIRNSSFLANFIESPSWSKELSDSVIRTVEHNKVKLEENPSPRQEALEFALERIKPIFQQRQLPRLSLPIFLLVLLGAAFASSYYLGMGAAMGIEMASIILGFLTLVYDYLKKR